MINSENVLNSRQLEQEIETFVHGFLKEKRDIHSSKVMWQVSDEQMEEGLDSSEVDMITANIINERNPVCYGADHRWANHLYPIYVTETFVKSKYLGENMFLNLF